MNAYRHSIALKKLRQAGEANRPLRLAFLDIDGTWAGRPADQQVMRDLLERSGYVIIQVTNRGSDMCLSRDINPAYTDALRGLLDPDILAASLGTELFVKQTSGAYQADEEYLRGLPSSNQDWRKQVSELLQRRRSSGFRFTTHYLDIPVFRVEAKFTDPAKAERLREELGRGASSDSLHLTRDNSTLIITPRGFAKETVVDHIFRALTKGLGVPTANFHVLLAGDSASDWRMGMEAARGSEATFLIPGGASLARELQLTKAERAGRVSAGVYRVPNANRHIVIGGEAFPGTAGPQTLLAWLNRTHDNGSRLN